MSIKFEYMKSVPSKAIYTKRKISSIQSKWSIAQSHASRSQSFKIAWAISIQKCASAFCVVRFRYCRCRANNSTLNSAISPSRTTHRCRPSYRDKLNESDSLEIIDILQYTSARTRALRAKTEIGPEMPSKKKKDFRLMIFLLFIVNSSWLECTPSHVTETRDEWLDEFRTHIKMCCGCWWQQWSHRRRARKPILTNKFDGSFFVAFDSSSACLDFRWWAPFRVVILLVIPAFKESLYFPNSSKKLPSRQTLEWINVCFFFSHLLVVHKSCDSMWRSRII